MNHDTPAPRHWERDPSMNVAIGAMNKTDFEDGRDQERAAIVQWLRSEMARIRKLIEERQREGERAGALLDIEEQIDMEVEAIERGDHLGGAKP